MDNKDKSKSRDFKANYYECLADEFINTDWNQRVKDELSIQNDQENSNIGKYENFKRTNGQTVLDS